MEKVHKVQLEMALEVKRLCQEHNIKYFIIAGTLLGAVRHKGFIPWDDDLDIGMIREDYERFVHIAKKEMKKEYFLQTWDTDVHFALPIAKLRKKGTKFIEQNSSKSNLHSGIYIDIFPFDNVPINNYKKKNQNYKTYVLKRLIITKQGYEVWDKNEHFKKIIYMLMKILTKTISLDKLKRMLGEEMTKYNSHKSDYVVTFGGAYGYWKETINRIWVDCLTTIKFEGHELSCPGEYREYLTYFYGDYMTPPPEDKRGNRHKIIQIELGED
ncbi:lipopolysaccharide cholinephosphotransferase [Paenibacillus sp. UNCCL117]|nr:lipopolysaccharide cholinephosphotransferase [Paenibacillus sp. cl123]SFW37308.1 lipopolysaccharide cholinephosphotransferase [Paenibacillus sp. UNCCL117]